MKARRSHSLLLLLAVLSVSCGGTLGLGTPKLHRVAWLSASSQAETTDQIDAFREAMRDLGYVEGRDLSLDIRWADGDPQRYPGLAAELVALKPDVIFVRSGPAAVALKRATGAIPIVIAGTDPIANGLVESLARPGANVTGVAAAGPEVAGRRLQLLKEAIPSAARVGFFYDASNPSQAQQYQQLRAAAPSLGIEVQPQDIRTPEDLAGAFVAAGRGQVDAVYLASSAVTNSQRARVLEFIATNHLPSMIAANRVYVDEGALLFYDEDIHGTIRKAAGYVDRILKGASAANMPIEKASKFDLIINLKTAKALGLTIPPSVLAQATELIR